MFTVYFPLCLLRKSQNKPKNLLFKISLDHSFIKLIFYRVIYLNVTPFPLFTTLWPSLFPSLYLLALSIFVFQFSSRLYFPSLPASASLLIPASFSQSPDHSQSRCLYHSLPLLLYLLNFSLLLSFLFPSLIGISPFFVSSLCFPLFLPFSSTCISNASSYLLSIYCRLTRMSPPFCYESLHMSVATSQSTYLYLYRPPSLNAVSKRYKHSVRTAKCNSTF